MFHKKISTMTAVAEDGSWSVVKPKLQNSIELTVAAHDTTGGMKTKIAEAAMIAKLGIDVYIVKAATSHSLRALNGDLRSSIPDDWLGTNMAEAVLKGVLGNLSSHSKRVATASEF
ncbi:Isopentenyl phosphate kinase [Glycine max]|nr:Isopentenyl phosphate kinase [Glycine max]